MRVGIVSGPRGTVAMGMETAERRLLQALAARRNGVELELRVVGGRAARRHAAALGGRWIPARPGGRARRAWRGLSLVHLAGLDVPPPERTPYVATVHDRAPLHFHDEGRLPACADGLARGAQRVVTPSALTARQLDHDVAVAAERIRVVPLAPGLAVSPALPPLTDAELAALGLRRPFVLRAGGYTARKNVALLLAAWPLVRRATGAQLALAGPAQAARAALLASAPSLDGVAVLDYVPDELLPRLFVSAAAVVSTSAYEGFGLPPLEAMAAGVPVVATRAPFVEEVCGDAALLAEPDAAALAAALCEVLSDEALRSRVRARGLERAAEFTWARTAAGLLAVYAEAAA